MKKISKKISVLMLVTVIALSSIMILISNPVVADAPVIAYQYPKNAAKYAYADTREGVGALYTVNVSDLDTNLQQVVLRANDSGSYLTFYDSGALGDVAYHNHSGYNYNWTGSWTKYWWEVCALDGVGWYNTTCNFTTAYQFGEIKMFNFSDSQDTDMSFANFIRNQTGEYHCLYYKRTTASQTVQIKNSTTGTNWSLEPASRFSSSATYSVPLCVFAYNNSYYFLLSNSIGSATNAYSYYYYGLYNGTTSSRMFTKSTGIPCDYGYYNGAYNYEYRVLGADCIYYNGKWNVVCWTAPVGAPYNSYATLRHYIGTFPSNWTLVNTIDSVKHYNDGATSDAYTSGDVSLEIWNGILYCVYRDGAHDVHWRTYDGATWADGGDIYLDAEHNPSTGQMLFPYTYLGTQYRGSHLTKDLVNNQLVVVYCETDGDLVYQVYNGTGWEPAVVILDPPSTKTICFPRADFIDSRLVVSFSYNLRGSGTTGENALYTISAPDYTKVKSGFNTTYNRIQFPDATPSATNVNSTVFALKNVDNRNVTAIDWHFNDVGDITCGSNFKIWTNMSGSWQGWLCDGSGDIAELDISSVMAGGAEWEKGTYTYWKLEILDIGGVSEDFHTVDESCFYKITLA